LNAFRRSGVGQSSANILVARADQNAALCEKMAWSTSKAGVVHNTTRVRQPVRSVCAVYYHLDSDSLTLWLCRTKWANELLPDIPATSLRPSIFPRPRNPQASVVLFLLAKVHVTNGNRVLACWEKGIIWWSRFFSCIYL